MTLKESSLDNTKFVPQLAKPIKDKPYRSFKKIILEGNYKGNNIGVDPIPQTPPPFGHLP